MSYLEPKSLGDVYGPGADSAGEAEDAIIEEVRRARKAGVRYELILRVIRFMREDAELLKAESEAERRAIAADADVARQLWERMHAEAPEG